MEEVHDVYLAYMYDLETKKTLIRDLVGAVFNQANESVLDGAMVEEYVTELTRERGSSQE